MGTKNIGPATPRTCEKILNIFTIFCWWLIMSPWWYQSSMVERCYYHGVALFSVNPRWDYVRSKDDNKDLLVLSTELIYVHLLN